MFIVALVAVFSFGRWLGQYPSLKANRWAKKLIGIYSTIGEGGMGCSLHFNFQKTWMDGRTTSLTSKMEDRI
jgi:hypothetical protein